MVEGLAAVAGQAAREATMQAELGPDARYRAGPVTAQVMGAGQTLLIARLFGSESCRRLFGTAALPGCLEAQVLECLDGSQITEEPVLGRE
jgi:hypothetical protein